MWDRFVGRVLHTLRNSGFRPEEDAEKEAEQLAKFENNLWLKQHVVLAGQRPADAPTVEARNRVVLLVDLDPGREFFFLFSSVLCIVFFQVFCLTFFFSPR